MRWHGKDVILYAFDLIELDGRDMRRVPIEERKATLAKLLRWASDGVAFNEHYSGDDAIIYRSLPRPSGVDGLCVDGPTRSLVVLRSDYRNFVELLAPLLQVLRAFRRDMANGTVHFLMVVLFHLVIDPLANTPLVTARWPERLQLRRRAEVDDLLPFVTLLIDERDVSAGQDLPRLSHGSCEAVARARG